MTKSQKRKAPAKTRAPKIAAPKDDLASARAQGQAQFDSIKEIVEALEAAENTGIEETKNDVIDRAREAIQDDPLSVNIRSGWYSPVEGTAATKPAEYEILLCTGGPACRIVGDLSEHGEPETARLEVQDWFQPWTAMRPLANAPGAGLMRVFRLTEVGRERLSVLNFQFAE